MSPPEDARGEVVRLPGGTPTEPDQPASRPGRLHGAAIAGMAVSALVGIAAMIAFITVRWPEDTGRYVVTILIIAGVSFLMSASIAVFAAARDTYPGPAPARGKDDGAN